MGPRYCQRAVPGSGRAEVSSHAAALLAGTTSLRGASRGRATAHLHAGAEGGGVSSETGTSEAIYGEAGKEVEIFASDGKG